MTLPAVVAAIGLVAAAGGAFLDWVAVDVPGIEALLAQLPNAPESLSLRGVALMQGKALVGLGVIGAIVVLLGGGRRVAGVVAVAIGAAAVLLAGTNVAEIVRVPEVAIPALPPGGLPTELPTGAGEPGQPQLQPGPDEALLRQLGGGTISVEIGVGLWIVLLGGLAALGAGAAMAVAREELTRYPPTPARLSEPRRAEPPAPPPSTAPPAPPPKRPPDEGPPPAWTPT